MGGKINPSAVLVIQNGVTKLVNIKNQDGMTKILDMVPDFINKFTSGKIRMISLTMLFRMIRTMNRKTESYKTGRAYIRNDICFLVGKMKRVWGYTLFWMGIGMLIMFL